MTAAPTTVKPGDVVSGREANRLPVGSRIRYAGVEATGTVGIGPALTKADDSDDAEWVADGYPMGWGIELTGRWLVVSVPPA